MRVMVIVKASPESERGDMPTEQLLTEMGKYNEQLVKAGVMLAGEGLTPSAKGKRVRFSGTQRTVIDGPFAESKELLGGFAVMDLSDMDETIAMCRRYAEILGGTLEIDVRPVEQDEPSA